MSSEDIAEAQDHDGSHSMNLCGYGRYPLPCHCLAALSSKLFALDSRLLVKTKMVVP